MSDSSGILAKGCAGSGMSPGRRPWQSEDTRWLLAQRHHYPFSSSATASATPSAQDFVGSLVVSGASVKQTRARSQLHACYLVWTEFVTDDEIIPLHSLSIFLFKDINKQLTKHTHIYMCIYIQAASPASNQPPTSLQPASNQPPGSSSNQPPTSLQPASDKFLF